MNLRGSAQETLMFSGMIIIFILVAYVIWVMIVPSGGGTGAI